MRVYPLHLLEGYKIKIRKDRDKYDGGLIEFVKNGFICKTIPEYTSDNIECICSEFTISKSKGICFSIYRAPVSSNLAIFFSKNCQKFSVKLSLNTRILYYTDPPRWNSICRGEGAYPPSSLNQSASMRRAQLSVAAKAVRPKDLLNYVKTWVNTD